MTDKLPMLDLAGCNALTSRDDTRFEAWLLRNPVTRNVLGEVMVVRDGTGWLGWYPLFDEHAMKIDDPFALADIVADEIIRHG